MRRCDCGTLFEGDTAICASCAVSEISRLRNERSCVFCPDQEDNDEARGYCPTHAMEMRDRVDALEAKLASRDTELIEAVARDLREAVGLLTTVTGYRDSDEATDQDWYAACDAIDAFLARPNIAALRPAGETTGSEGK